MLSVIVRIKIRNHKNASTKTKMAHFVPRVKWQDRSIISWKGRREPCFPLSVRYWCTLSVLFCNPILLISWILYLKEMPRIQRSLNIRIFLWQTRILYQNWNPVLQSLIMIILDGKGKSDEGEFVKDVSKSFWSTLSKCKRDKRCHWIW